MSPSMLLWTFKCFCRGCLNIFVAIILIPPLASMTAMCWYELVSKRSLRISYSLNKGRDQYDQYYDEGKTGVVGQYVRRGVSGKRNTNISRAYLMSVFKCRSQF